MSLLDKLMEKKDLDAYLRLRIRRLKQEITERIDRYPAKDRERLMQTTEVRIKELSMLGNVLRSNTIKLKCKMMWKHFNYPTKKKPTAEDLANNLEELKEEAKRLYPEVEATTIIVSPVEVPSPVTPAYPKEADIPKDIPKNIFKSDKEIPRNLFKKREDKEVISDGNKDRDIDRMQQVSEETNTD